MATTIKHPAQYSPAIVDKMLEVVGDRRGLLIDPFAGPGQQLQRFVRPRRRVVGIEIEEPWAAMSPLVEQGDATRLPFRAGSVSTIITSPCYGNRFADHHRARDNSSRRSYTHDIREQTGNLSYELAANNAGTDLFDSIGYDQLHTFAWRELFRVARPGAMFLLNVSDSYRRGDRQRVSSWHVRRIEGVGFDWVNAWLIPTRRMGHGAHRELRADGEWLFHFTKAEVD